ncbi:MAG: hypothetical protein JOZ68_03680 [Acidimicrobiia bacterium]|nr:hypothetical protein [Acidimicrobiia bacterium]
MARVPVGRADQSQHLAAFGDDGLAVGDFGRGQPDQALTRVVVAQRLLDDGRGERWIGTQPIGDVGPVEESEHGVGDKVGRRLVAGDEQKDAERDQLRYAEPVLFVSGHEQADQVVTRCGTALADDAGEEDDDLCATAEHPADAAAAHQPADQVVGPALEVLASLRGHAEHLGDDRRRERRPKATHQVDRAGPCLIAQVVDQRFGDLANPGLPLGDHPRRKGLADLASEHGVFGRIARE